MPETCTATDAFGARCQLPEGHAGKHHREFQEGSWRGESNWNDQPFEGELRELATALSADNHSHLLDERSLRALSQAHAALNQRVRVPARPARRRHA